MLPLVALYVTSLICSFLFFVFFFSIRYVFVFFSLPFSLCRIVIPLFLMPSSCVVLLSTCLPVTNNHDYSSFNGYAHLASGLSCGLSGLAAGMAIGIVGDAGVRANGQQPKLFVGMVLILIFAEALGLYGLIVALILSQQKQDC